MAVLVLALGLVGCSLFGSTTDQAANSTKTITTYNNVSQSELEENLTKYREIAESLSGRVSDLEEVVQQLISASQTNIGAYSSVYINSVLVLTCSEPNNPYVDGAGGTGFVISEDGYVLTNNHVVAYGVTSYDEDNIIGTNIWGQVVYGNKKKYYTYSSVKASFDADSDYPNDSSYTLEVVYRDPAYDLALCKIVESVPVGTAWKPIPLYAGNVVRGESLLVLGNANGDGLSATSGIISATGRTFPDSPQLSFIQTDAAINGGNSGGPAINIYGGLVGVVNSKYVSTNIENMGFAIELDKVKEFLTAAQTNASVTVTYKTVSAPTNTESVAA